MKVTKQEITKDNVFEQMALMTKSNLIQKGILPDVANQIAVDFAKERGMQILTKIANDDNKN